MCGCIHTGGGALTGMNTRALTWVRASRVQAEAELLGQTHRAGDGKALGRFPVLAGKFPVLPHPRVPGLQGAGRGCGLTGGHVPPSARNLSQRAAQAAASITSPCVSTKAALFLAGGTACGSRQGPGSGLGPEPRRPHS